MSANDEIETLFKQGRQCYHLHHFNDAEQYAIRILDNDPHHDGALYLLAMISIKKNNRANAIEYLHKLLAIQPNHIIALNNMGALLLQSGKYENALSYFLNAANMAPTHSALHINIAKARSALEQHDGALTSYDQALTLAPDNMEAITGRAALLAKMGMFAESLSDYKHALSIHSESAEAQWACAMLSIIVDSFDKKITSIFENNALLRIEALANWSCEHHVNGEDIVGLYQLFTLSYSQKNNKRLLSAYGKLCCDVMQNTMPKPHLATSPSTAHQRIKIGIVSADIGDHSVWHAIIKNIIRHLDKNNFDIYVFYVGTRHDTQTQWAKENSTYFINGLHSLTAWRESIIHHCLDVLIYPAIGMDTITLQLASLRLAPTQMVSWGHPETSGLPTIDYYLSGQVFEPENAAQYYTEKLVVLPSMGTCYTPLLPNEIDVDLNDFGLNKQYPILIAPGVAVKYDSAYDFIFVEIAKKLKRCTFVFFQSQPLALSKALYNRLSNQFANAGLHISDYVVFIPWQKMANFFSIMKQSDVFLDTIGFSGFNTVMHAIECTLPIVTMEGKLMRGRFGSGILRSINLDCLVVNNEQDYISLVVKLATDKDYQQSIRHKISDSRVALYGNTEPIRFLEKILLDAATSR